MSSQPEEQPLHRDNHDRESDPQPQELPYVTTSDLLSRLNQNLSDLSIDNGHCYERPPRFELQKRLDNGSTIPASPSDLAYSDLQNKIQQSATFVAQLTLPDKMIWAEQQRQIGNSYFGKGDYQAAMDIYLTCLVVKGSYSSSLDFVEKTLLPILNNLAQCTLQLGMLKKTIEFCDIALEEIQNVTNGTDDSTGSGPPAVDIDVDVDALAQAKIWFKRAKARRLTGLYPQAREDLNAASSWLDKKKTANETMDLEIYRRAIQKELKLLETSQLQARKNRQRQKISLQRALQPRNDDEGKEHEQSLEIKAPRQFSSLRTCKTTAKKHPERESPPKVELSYYQFYCLMVVRVTETLLIWLGDDETIKRVKERVD